MSNGVLDSGFDPFEVSPTTCDLDLDSIDLDLEWLQKPKYHRRKQIQQASDDLKALTIGLTKSSCDILNLSTDQFTNYSRNLNPE